MRSSVLWLLWLVLPVFVLAYHYGPGQLMLARDQAAALIHQAQTQSVAATQAQETAYQSQLDLLVVRRTAFVAGVDWQAQPEHPLAKSVLDATSEQDTAYETAAELWKATSDLYGEATETLLKAMSAGKAKEASISRKDQDLLESLRWAEARAMVRSGEVFHGVEQLQALLDLRLAEEHQAASSAVASSDVASTAVHFSDASRHRSDKSTLLATDAIREELAAAQYIGARLLREEGRPPEVWRPVANEARQHYRYLAAPESKPSAAASATVTDLDRDAGSSTSKEAATAEVPSTQPSSAQATNVESQSTAAALGRDQRLQRNLEQVLNLEQSTSDQLEGLPLPRRAPLARRPGDSEPGNRPGKGPGRGPLRDGPPGDGGGIPGPYGMGW